MKKNSIIVLTLLTSLIFSQSDKESSVYDKSYVKEKFEIKYSEGWSFRWNDYGTPHRVYGNNIPYGPISSNSTFSGLCTDSFEVTLFDANACKVIDTTGCYGVKLEGGKEIANTVSYLTNRGIKVMGHIGLVPQSIVNFIKINISGFKKLEKEKLLDDAKALFNSGVFSIVIEAVAETAAKLIVREIMKNKEKFVPIIGIGASKHCNGQILVTDDIIGASYKFKDKKIPKFVKVYNESNLESSVKKFCEEVKKKVFPGDEYVYKNSMNIFNNITYLQFSNKK